MAISSHRSKTDSASGNRHGASSIENDPRTRKLESDEEVEQLCHQGARSPERKPYSFPAAIANVFQLPLRCNPEIAGFNPLALWNTRHTEAPDQSGPINRLYE